MAGKKTYSIEINGITESVKAIDALTQRLDNLQKAIKAIQGGKISIPVELSTDIGKLTKDLQSLKTKVSKTTSNTSDDKEYNKLLREREKALEAVNRELADTGKNAKEYKEETKQLVAELTKERNETKTYANTLNGLKAELKDLNAYKGNLDLGGEEYQQVSDKIFLLTTRLKELEAAQGIHSRNVGNYTQSITDALDDFSAFAKECELAETSVDDLAQSLEELGTESLDMDSLREFGVSIEQIKNRIDSLQKQLKTLDIGSDEWNKVNKEIVNLKSALGVAESGFKSAAKSGEDFGRKIKMNVNGIDYEFNGINKAIQGLSKELQSMYVNGKQDTQEFKNLADAIRNMRKETYWASQQLNEFTKYETPIESMVGQMQGIGAAMQVGSGLANIFGSDKDMQKSMNTMMALMSVMQGLAVIEKQMNTGEGAGGWFKNLNSGINKTLSLLNIFKKDIEKVNKSLNPQAFTKFPKEINKSLNSVDAHFNGVLQASNKLNTAWEKLTATGKKLGVEGNTVLKFSEKLSAEINALQVQSAHLAMQGEELNAVDKKRLADLKALEVEYERLATAMGNYSLNAGSAFKIMGKGISNGLVTVVKNLGNAFMGLGKWVASLGKNILTLNVKGVARNFGLLASETNKTSSAFKLFTVATKGLNIAMKALNYTLKAFVIFALLEALMKAIDVIMNTIQWIKKITIGNGDLANSFDTVASHIENANTAFDRYTKRLERAEASGFINSQEKAGLTLEYVTNQLKIAGNEMKRVSDIQKNNWAMPWDDIAPEAKHISNLEAFRKEFELYQQAVEAGTDINKVKGNTSWNPFSGDFWSEMWNTASDARDDYADLQKEVLGDLQWRINQIDWTNLDMSDTMSKNTQAAKELFKIMNDDMYQTSIKNIENLYPEEEWAKVLKARLEQVQDMYDKMDEAAYESGQAQIEIQKKIRDNWTQAIADDTQRNIKQIQDQWDDELQTAGGNMELIASINAKYQRQMADAKKKGAKDGNKAVTDEASKLAEILRKIRDNNLEAEAESLQKRIEKIKNAEADELAEAKKTAEEMKLITSKRYEWYASIQKKYQKQIQDEYKKHNDFLLKLTEDYTRKEIALRQQLQDAITSNKGENVEIEYNANVNSSIGDYNFGAEFKARLEEEKKFNNERLQLELDYLEKKKQVDLESENNDYSKQLESEKQRYNDGLQQLKKYFEDGQITRTEYYAKMQKEEELNKKTLEKIELEHSNRVANINKQFFNEYKATTSASLKEIATIYDEYVGDIDEAIQSIGADKNFLGTMSIGKAVKNYEFAKKEIKTALNGIKQEYRNLDEALNKGEITFFDYKEAKSQFRRLEKELTRDAKLLKNDLGNIIQEGVGQFNQLVGSWVNQVSSMLQTLNDTKMQLINNQLTEIERQLDIQQKAYEEAEKAAEAHKDKMNGIEDELADARGSRRQFLIDSLAAQQQAYLDELATKEKAELEKQKLEKKKEKLEKKRREQEKKANIQQAIINTFTAVSNALAVQPWFLGLALSAVALGLGMANVAAIKQTPIYEDGGVIRGKRHSQGGVPVLGGQAEVEGGEFITNRKSTKANLGLLEMINSKKSAVTADDLMAYFNGKTPKVRVNRTANKFAEGGMLPTLDTDALRTLLQPKNVQEPDDRPVVVSVVDIINAEDKLKKVQALSGLNN